MITISYVLNRDKVLYPLKSYNELLNNIKLIGLNAEQSDMC